MTACDDGRNGGIWLFVQWQLGGMRSILASMRLRRIHRRIAGLMLALLLVPSAAQAAWWWPFGSGNGLDYSIEITGVDEATQARLHSWRLDKPTTANPPETEDDLNREALALEDTLRRAMEALGHYDAQVHHEVKHDEGDRTLVYTVVPGPRYTIRHVRLDWDGGALKPVDVSSLDSKDGTAVDAEMILRDGVRILHEVGEDTCLLSLDVIPKLTLFVRGQRADLTFHVVHGPVASFGATVVSGTRKVKPEVVLKRVSWKQGACFNQNKIEETRTALIDGQLFSSVDISHSLVPDAGGEVPMTVTVKERALRTLKAGVNYSTDQGAVLTGGWEHRNFFGNAEKFNADTSLGQFKQSLDTSLRIPDFMQPGQVLALGGGISQEDQDAYRATSLKTNAGIERPLLRNLRGGVGVGFTLTESEDALAGQKKTYGLLSFPGFLTYDTRDDVLDTRKGIYANVNVTPYTETFGDGGQFIKTQAVAQTYLSSQVALSPTLALKLAGGSISGGEGADLPSDLRFYAGGGGSVRGYGYQTLGPRKNNTPVGGNSFITASAEGRLRFTGDFGGVVFADAGNVYDSSSPQTGANLYTSVGVGVRYFTAIGPLRADIAVPLNGEDIGAPAYGLYISIGQSF